MEIKGFPHYLIYDDGLVYNQKFDRFLKGCLHVKTKKYTDNKYWVIKLNKKVHYIHRLVALNYCFNDNPKIKTCVDHIDGNCLNNVYSNLRWVTKRENAQNAKIRRDNTSGFQGIDKYSTKKWRAR